MKYIDKLNIYTRFLLPFLVTLGGFAALSWEVIWQVESTLALGISAWGTALTLAVTMGGMGLGSLLMSCWLGKKVPEHPLRLYAMLEILIGLSGLCLLPLFRVLASLDAAIYESLPASSFWGHVLGVAAILGVPTMCMGATIPILGLAARQYNVSLAVLYGLNVMGAALGALIVAFFVIPHFGVLSSCLVIASINVGVGATILTLRPSPRSAAMAPVGARLSNAGAPPSYGLQCLLVAVTGFSTLALEVAWFRSLTSAFLSTTDSFAIMLAVVLVSLGAAAALVPLLKEKAVPLGPLVIASGGLIMLATPLIANLYLITPPYNQPVFVMIDRLVKSFLLLGPPMMCLGLALPWILDAPDVTPRHWGQLYALNTFAAIVGAGAAALVFLPHIGVERTAWLVGILVIFAGAVIMPGRGRFAGGVLGIAALIVALGSETKIGRSYVPGLIGYENKWPVKVLGFFEGAEATTAAVEYNNGARALIINGFVTTAQDRDANIASSSSYMLWMGYLPMLLHPNPKNALVICFGTGQTAHAVRQEKPDRLDIVDINPQVFKLAHHFDQNAGVLADPIVRTVVMDGRAYLRRKAKIYDVITLEPMPPNFAGVNALYSREFYELARQRLSDEGMIAQWVPFHVAEPRYMMAIMKTFQSVFPNSILWVDPTSKTGILLGSKDEKRDLTGSWPGFGRQAVKRLLLESEIMDAIWLDRDGLRRYSGSAVVITDDNQHLAFGKAVNGVYQARDYKEDSMTLLNQARLAPNAAWRSVPPHP